MNKETRNDFDFNNPNLDGMSTREFFDIYKKLMFSVAIKEGLDKGDADMAVDDVMLTIFVKKACNFDPKKSHFSTYLTTMVRNACRSLKRREHRYMYFEEEDMIQIFEENGALVQDKELEAKEIRKCIDEGIQILRQEVRSQLMVDAFVMMVIDEERPKDIAQKLNVRPDYVSLAKNRCLPKLRAILRRIME